MDIRLQLTDAIKPCHLRIAGSKSESNRLLLLQALFPQIYIQKISPSDDTIAMQAALATTYRAIDIGHAGTAMRFLTAYFAIQEGREIVLTGSKRMQERPIAVLVEALRNLGADIEYAGKEGYPPLKITGKKLAGGTIAVNAGTSSQFVTALMLIAPMLDNGLEIVLEGEITSRPYIDMTLSLFQDAGFTAIFEGNIIRVMPARNIMPKTLTVESDWSSASYFYSVVALAHDGFTMSLSSFRQNSRQGDRALVDIYRQFGVDTIFKADTITLTKVKHNVSAITLDLNNTPDIAQTIAVTCFGLGVKCDLYGLHTLKIKETNRLAALKIELEKLGAAVTVTANSLHLEAKPLKINSNVAIETYNDHRMAMAFAPLAVKMPVVIKDAGVVSKSYPAFWEDMARLGFSVSYI